MAARHKNFQNEKTREKIRSTQLIHRLERFALGENDPATDKPIEMTPAQVKAIQVLLDKTLPSLQSVDQTVENVAPRSEEEMLTQLREMIARNPALKDLLKVN